MHGRQVKNRGFKHFNRDRHRVFLRGTKLCRCRACHKPDRGAKRCVAIDGTQFIGRLPQHVLPPGFKRIRHYELLAPAAKTHAWRWPGNC